MQECREFLDEAALNVRTLIDETGSAEQLFQVVGTPFGYLLDKQGRVLIRGVVNDAAQLHALLDQEGSLEPPQSPQDHAPAPTPYPASVAVNNDKEPRDMTKDPTRHSRRGFMWLLGGGAVGVAAVTATAVAGGTAEARRLPRSDAERLQRAERRPGPIRGVKRGPIFRKQANGGIRGPDPANSVSRADQ